MAIHGFDIAVGMSQERVHIFTVAAQYTLSKDYIDTILQAVLDR